MPSGPSSVAPCSCRPGRSAPAGAGAAARPPGQHLRAALSPGSVGAKGCLLPIELSGSSGKLCGGWQECDAGLTAWFMAPAVAPGEGVAVPVPVVGCLCDGLADLVPALETASRQGE